MPKLPDIENYISINEKNEAVQILEDFKRKTDEHINLCFEVSGNLIIFDTFLNNYQFRGLNNKLLIDFFKLTIEVVGGYFL